MHTGACVGHIVLLAQTLHHVVGVEHRVLGGLRDTLPAQGEDIGQGFDHHCEVAAEVLYPSDGVLWPGQMIAGLVLHHHRAGEVGPQKVLAAHRAGAGTAASVGGGEGLVQIQMDYVEAHISGPDHAHNGVEIGPIVVTQAAGIVDDPCNF